MKVVHLNADPGVAPEKKKGASVHVEAMRRAFTASGAEVVALDESDEHRLCERLAAAEASGSIDLIYERHALGAFAGSEFARELEIPHVVEVNAPLAAEESLYRGAARTPVDLERERRYFRSAARVLCVSSECARHAVASGADEARVVVEPNAVDPDLFRPRTDERLRDELVPKGSLVVGFHGRLRPWHNFALLVEALELLLAEGLPIHLLVLGEGPIRDELGRGPLAKHATIVGWKPHAEAAATVACMDVVPLTYSPDNPFWYSPLKLLEAMAVGAVPIVPRMGDLPNVVMHGVEGLVYAPGDVSALVGAIRSLASDDAWRVFLSRGARRRAERRSWNAIAADVLTLARERRPA